MFVQHIIANFGILDKMSHICSNIFFFYFPLLNVFIEYFIIFVLNKSAAAQF